MVGKPLMKVGLVLGLMLLLILGGARSGMGAGTVLLVLFVLVFLFWPRRRA